VDPREIVASGYDAVAESYARLEESEWPRIRWLRDLLDRLPDGAHVLDLGCGNGVPADREIARRHTVTGVDISARQIELARRHVPSGVFFHADMTRVSFPPGTFDAVVSFYAIGCIPRVEHAALLRRIREWLRPGGWLLLSEEDVDRPDVVGECLGVPMFFSGFDAATQRRLVEEAGFVVERAAVEAQVEQGVEVPFAWVLARVPE
jgi:SAM-dependent methyltransferase